MRNQKDKNISIVNEVLSIKKLELFEKIYSLKKEKDLLVRNYNSWEGSISNAGMFEIDKLVRQIEDEKIRLDAVIGLENEFRDNNII